MLKWEYSYLVRSRSMENYPKRGGTDWKVRFLAQGIDQIVVEDFLTRLSEMGEAGWELVSVTPRTDFWGEGTGGFTSSEIWVFKRQKQ